ncbi:MAG: SDR family oxidoreductase [Acidimicrobiia bacterium]|nr:SDR family oxidoreductase [Acidimicrobiia bacterium]
MGQLEGKVALVTGGGSGIGRAAAERLAADGARVCVVDWSEEPGRLVAEELEGLHLHADVGDPGQVDEAFAACERELGGLDVVHLNAGVTTGHGDLEQLTVEEYRRITRVNLDGVVFGVRAAIPALARRRGGAIVVTASLAGIIPFAPDPIYALTKHGVVGLVRSLAPSLQPRGIRVSCVCPGLVDTPLLGTEARELMVSAGFPLLDPADVAEAVLLAVTDGEGGEAWVVQPGRPPEPYRFHDVPGPRGEDLRTAVPPGVRGGRPAGDG